MPLEKLLRFFWISGLFFFNQIQLTNFCCKGPNTKILCFAGSMISVTTIQLSLCSGKAAIDNVQRKEHGCVPIKLYFQKQGAGQFWPMSYLLGCCSVDHFRKLFQQTFLTVFHLEPQNQWWLFASHAFWGELRFQWNRNLGGREQ